MIKKYVLTILLIFILIIILFHLNEFLKTNNKYQILQVDKLLYDYRDYYLDNLPIVFTNHIDFSKNLSHNFKRLLSPLTIRQKNISNKISNRYITHNKDKFFIYTNKESIINLISPKEINNFQKDNYNPNIKILKVINKSYNFIELKLKPGNIVYIPRKWIVHSEKPYNIYFSETIFSFLFTFYEIIPFIKNKLF
jgi:hypothetical protein